MINQFDIQPLLITQVNWQIFNKWFPDAVRFLDSIGLDLNDPVSYLKALSKNDMIKTLGRLGFWAFIGECKKKSDILEFIAYAGVDIYYLNRIFILSGTLEKWQSAILNTSTKEVNTNTRNISNACLIYFEQTAFRNEFKKYKKEYLADETFILI